ncbi:2-dehydro-3-deoxygalactonokinase [Trabulsiella odontotermitis]|uniref:2-dehydro-3-deoxygalactonokinase n=1 Tax=Trabulsiella odontotermitis TaxID=379893 RepID=A0A0L0H171_9ENTR|nr:2-dehydro-3-deoxygalactonokinase [Trabulsiella odontotermitis]KNC94483.1 2-dehydro-3-deoxygalactonokinase [Trabulsiella odontotermitis]
MKNNWIAIDWGTTNFRAFLLENNQVIDRLSEPCGLLSVKEAQFAATLQRLLSPWLDATPPLPIVMAGMVGSQQGWKNVPYAPLPAGAGNLVDGAYAFRTPWGSPGWIIPGVNGTSRYGQPDVMRGEEIQLLGLAVLHPAEKHLALLPGTHSKQARMVHGEIIDFSTFMTGELFSLLSEQSLLGRDLPLQTPHDASFALGVETALQGAPFSHLIFSARTRRLNGEVATEHVHSYLSGLLIGHELAALEAERPAWVVGSPALTARYLQAAEIVGLTLTAVDGDHCFLHGLGLLRSLIQEKIA